MVTLSEKELFHIALKEIQEGNHGSGMTHLKQLLEINPDSTDGHFLLGAEYAQLAMYDEAEAHLTKAVELTPELDIARFQLALVQLARGNFQTVKNTLQSLLTSDKTYLQLFAKGIISCVENQPEDAIRLIEEGIQNNQENPSLNTDMEGVITAIRNLPTAEPDQPGEAAESEDETGLVGSDYLLGAYKN